MEIERPLMYNKKWEFTQFKSNLLNTNHIVDELPELAFLDGLDKH